MSAQHQMAFLRALLDKHTLRGGRSSNKQGGLAEGETFWAPGWILGGLGAGGFDSFTSERDFSLHLSLKLIFPGLKGKK